MSLFEDILAVLGAAAVGGAAGYAAGSLIVKDPGKERRDLERARKRRKSEYKGNNYNPNY